MGGDRVASTEETGVELRRSMRRGRVLLVALAVMVAAGGCTSGVRSPLEHEVTKRVTPEKSEFDIDGWTDHTGVHHELKGRARIGGDSVQFFERRYTTWGSPDATGKVVANVPRSDVIADDVRKFSPGKPGILFLAPVAAFYVFLIIAYGQEY